MKLTFSNEWLRRSFASDIDDGDIDAIAPGVDVVPTLKALRHRVDQTPTADERVVVQLRIALGTFVRDLRLRQNLTIEELAHAADVSVNEVRQVEHDPHFTARPRFIHQLSTFFSVPLVKLSRLAGTSNTIDTALYNQAVRYAACSDDQAELSSSQQELLDSFIAVLNERSASDS